MSEGVIIDVGAGDLIVNDAGVEFEPLRGEPVKWTWAHVRHVDFEAGDGSGLLRRGLLGLIMRPRSRVFLTTDDGDVPFVIRNDLGALRAVARRIVVNIPEARGKISVAGQVLSE